MKPKLTVAVAAILYSTMALANEPEVPNPAPALKQAQAQEQSQAQEQAQTQSQSQTASASNEGVSQSVSFQDRLQAPSIAAPSVFPTATCQSGISIGGSSAGGGGLLGFSFTKRECELVVLAQNYLALGMYVPACETLNKTKAARRAFGNNLPACSAPVPVVVPEPKPTVVVITGESCGMSKERAERVFEKCLSK